VEVGPAVWPGAWPRSPLQAESTPTAATAVDMLRRVRRDMDIVVLFFLRQLRRITECAVGHIYFVSRQTY
jgi:hypothetical protein